MNAEWVVRRKLHARHTAQQRQQIRQRALHPIHFAELQRGDGGRRIGQHRPLHAIEGDTLAAREKIRWFLAWTIFFEPRERGARARLPFIGREPIRATADELGDLLQRRRVGDPLRHDEEESVPPQHRDHAGEGASGRDLESAIVKDTDPIHLVQEFLPDAASFGPTIEGCDTVGGADGFVIVEEQPIAQSESPCPAVRGHFVAGHHLRAHLAFDCLPKERIPDHETAIACIWSNGYERIRVVQTALRHKPQDTRVVPRDRRAGKTDSRRGGDIFQQFSPFHLDHPLLFGCVLND